MVGTAHPTTAKRLGLVVGRISAKNSSTGRGAGACASGPRCFARFRTLGDVPTQARMEPPGDPMNALLDEPAVAPDGSNLGDLRESNWPAHEPSLLAGERFAPAGTAALEGDLGRLDREERHSGVFFADGERRDLLADQQHRARRVDADETL